MADPRQRIWPRLGESKPTAIRTVVLLPEPLGPSSPMICPGAVERVRDLTAGMPR